MKKRITTISIIFLIIIMSFLAIQKTIYCHNIEHKETIPANPFCTTCRQIDGIVQHNCTNPDGKEIYCPSCGKIAKY